MDDIRKMTTSDIQALCNLPKVKERAAQFGIRVDAKKGVIITDPVKFLSVVIPAYIAR